MDNQQLSFLNKEKSSTTSHKDVGSSEPKWETSIYKIDEDIVWSLNENLKKFNKKYHYIYKTTNKITEDFYIGRHSTNNLLDGYLGSGKRLKNSIKKYSKNNFIKEILYFCKSLKDLVLLEKQIVNENLIKNIKCLNITVGGINAILMGESNPNFGKKLSKERRLKLSQRAKTLIGDKNPFFGKTHTKETKEKIAEIHRGAFGSKNSFYGKTHSEDYKKESSKRMKNKFNENPKLRDIISNNKKLLYKENAEIWQRYWYHTPNGIFKSMEEAAKMNNCGKHTIHNRCGINADKIFKSKCVKKSTNLDFLPDNYQDNKTLRELGWFKIEFNREITNSI
jgi:group I intron endonuclease